MEMSQFGYWSHKVNPIQKSKNKNNIFKNIMKNKSISEKEKENKYNKNKEKKKKMKIYPKFKGSKNLLFIRSSRKRNIDTNSINSNTQLNEKKNNNKKYQNKNNKNGSIINPSIFTKNENQIKIVTNNFISVYNNSKYKNINNNNSNKDKKFTPSQKSYSLIQIDANNTMNNIPVESYIILDNYDYESSIKYDKRTFLRIFSICLLAKENFINIIFFRTPLDLQSLRLCLFIFVNACDLAFNTIFYSNENISDKYHYK